MPEVSSFRFRDLGFRASVSGLAVAYDAKARAKTEKYPKKNNNIST